MSNLDQQELFNMKYESARAIERTIWIYYSICSLNLVELFNMQYNFTWPWSLNLPGLFNIHHKSVRTIQRIIWIFQSYSIYNLNLLELFHEHSKPTNAIQHKSTRAVQCTIWIYKKHSIHCLIQTDLSNLQFSTDSLRTIQSDYLNLPGLFNIKSEFTRAIQWTVWIYQGYSLRSVNLPGVFNQIVWFYPCYSICNLNPAGLFNKITWIYKGYSMHNLNIPVIQYTI